MVKSKMDPTRCHCSDGICLNRYIRSAEQTRCRYLNTATRTSKAINTKALDGIAGYTNITCRSTCFNSDKRQCCSSSGCRGAINRKVTSSSKITDFKIFWGTVTNCI